jgi:hypothetical protein
MSIESFSPLPLNVFGTWVTLLDPSDVPAGMSPSLGDVEFFPGGVRTRPGLASQFAALAGTPQINGVKLTRRPTSFSDFSRWIHSVIFTMNRRPACCPLPLQE